MAFIGFRQFQATLWTLCGIATLLFCTRIAIRIDAKGRLMMNDYFLIFGLSSLLIGTGLLHSTLRDLYSNETVVDLPKGAPRMSSATAARFTGAIELFWICIYCVKFCFLAQFKFYKPPYAYISANLTRYYWVAVGTSTVGFLFSLIQPIVLCRPERCTYFSISNTLPWETTAAVVDITTDLLVISIPILLVRMANFGRVKAIINASFKGLSIINIAISSTRLALQYDAQTRSIRYLSLTYWLTVEAAVAIIMASMSSYRVLVLHYIEERITNQPELYQAPLPKIHRIWFRARRRRESTYLDSAIDGSHQNIQSVSGCTKPAVGNVSGTERR